MVRRLAREERHDAPSSWHNRNPRLCRRIPVLPVVRFTSTHLLVMSCSNAGEKFNVVILYDHFLSVGRAMAAYLHVTRELESEFTPELRIWRLDVATSPECAGQAEDDIMAAEMVIMAVRGSQPCPAGFQRWAEGAVARGCLPKQALIAIGEAGAEPGGSVGAWNGVLQRTAAQIPRDVFLWTPSAAAETPAPPAPFSGAGPGREEPALEPLDGVGQTS